ncbi:MAG: hypothetical protein M0Z95_19245 [Actinomycetota bacterium]|jgi:hypothetical protein|nr:hypothetical protein [Actinomycetota bacterium]
MHFLIPATQSNLYTNGISLVFLGVLGVFATFVGSKRFEPKMKGAQRGRWLASRHFGRLLVLGGIAGVVMILVAKL